MLKFLGSLFIVSSMTGIGIWKAEEVKHSYQALGKIYHLIGMMKNELSYAGSEFGEMFECVPISAVLAASTSNGMFISSGAVNDFPLSSP